MRVVSLRKIESEGSMRRIRNTSTIKIRINGLCTLTYNGMNTYTQLCANHQRIFATTKEMERYLEKDRQRILVEKLKLIFYVISLAMAREQNKRWSEQN